ncbi:MAG TPA: tetratricopeptide repeat protein, partial [Opitutaceae bacterium]|nr:tetratricopeptide repeat protein [Opitutaceae bacterium]
AAEYREAARIAPDNADVRYNYGALLAQLGRTSAAADEFRAALRLRPDFAAAHAALDRVGGQ